MKQILISILLLVPFFNYANENEQLIKLRNKFYAVAENKIQLEEYSEFLYQQEQNNLPAIQGYQAMLFMFQAKKSWNPYHKFNYFNKGRNLLEQLINQNQSNIELRFLRLCIQVNLPAILNYDNRNSDLKYLKENINELDDKDLSKRIESFLSKNDLI